jgi:hypothetical protein
MPDGESRAAWDETATRSNLNLLRVFSTFSAFGATF